MNSLGNILCYCTLLQIICTHWTPFRAERDWKFHTERFFKFPSSIYSILYELNRILQLSYNLFLHSTYLWKSMKELNNVLISSLTISFTETKLAVFPTYWFFRLFNLTLFSLTYGLLTGCLGRGGQLDPPLYLLIVIQIYQIWYVFGKPLATSIIFKKLANLQKFKYLLRYLVIKQKMCKNLHIFEKPLTQRIQMCKNICKMYIQEKLKLCKFPSKAYVQICAKFLCKTCAICLLLFKAFQRTIKCWNLLTGSRSKYRFSLV